MCIVVVHTGTTHHVRADKYMLMHYYIFSLQDLLIRCLTQQIEYLHLSKGLSAPKVSGSNSLL